MFNKLELLRRHLWLDTSDTRRAIPPDMQDRLAARVAASERHHSGQIRICIEAALPASYLWRFNSPDTLNDLIRQRAIAQFSKLRVWDTEHNNGVLIYLLLAEQAIEIVADRALMRHVTTQQWQAMITRMSNAFHKNCYEDGLAQALEETSAVLMTHFAKPDDMESCQIPPNELPDLPMRQ